MTKHFPRTAEGISPEWLSEALGQTLTRFMQLAARVRDRAEPGQVLVSPVVRDLCTGKTFQFDDQGEATLTGFPEPVRLFVVGEGA